MNHLFGSSGDEAADMAAKDLLIESSLDQLFDEFDYALEQGIAEPVVFLIDCEDELGSPMARAWEGDEAVDAAIIENAADVECGTQKSELGNPHAAAGVAPAVSGQPQRPEDCGEPAAASGRMITTLARAFSLSDCRREVPDVFPYLAETLLDPPPTDGFLAVVVTAGGAAAFTVPHSARP